MNDRKRADGSVMSLQYAESHLEELGFPKEVTDEGDPEALITLCI